MDRDVSLNILSICELISAIGPNVYLSSSARCNCAKLLQEFRQLPTAMQHQVKNVAREKLDECDRHQCNVADACRLRRRLEQEGSSPLSVTASEDDFLQSPSSQIINNCYAQFYDATSNAAMAFIVCAVCASRM